MKAWIAGFIVLVGLGGGAIYLQTKQPTRHVVARESQALTELTDQVAQLKQRLGTNEATTTYLVNNAGSARRASLQTKLEPPHAEEAEAAPPPPTVKEEMARFEKHFSNLDEQRGKVPDPALEAKFNRALSDTADSLAILKHASLDRVACGNQLCRVEVTFPDVVTARLGQTQLQQQLAALATSFTAYMEPESRHLQAYFAIGSAQIPAFPTADPAL